MLASVGVTTQLEVPAGESEARLSSTQLGLTLIFDREDENSNRLVLTSVHLVSDAEEGYTSCAGALPNQLDFSDSPAVVHRKLGEPTRTKSKLRLEFRRSDDLQLSVNHNALSGMSALARSLQLATKYAREAPGQYLRGHCRTSLRRRRMSSASGSIDASLSLSIRRR